MRALRAPGSAGELGDEEHYAAMFREARDSPGPAPVPLASRRRRGRLALRRRLRLRGRPGRRRRRGRGVHQQPAGADPAVRAPRARSGRPACARGAPPPGQGPSDRRPHSQQHAHSHAHADSDGQPHPLGDAVALDEPPAHPLTEADAVRDPDPHTDADADPHAVGHPDPHTDPDTDPDRHADRDSDPAPSGGRGRGQHLRLDPQGGARPVGRVLRRRHLRGRQARAPCAGRAAALSGGGWSPVASGRTDASGQVSLVLPPISATTAVRLRSNGVHSSRWRVTLHPQLSVTSTRGSEAGTVVITATAVGAQPGDRVQLLTKSGQVASATLDGGTVAFTVTPDPEEDPLHGPAPRHGGARPGPRQHQGGRQEAGWRWLPGAVTRIRVSRRSGGNVRCRARRCAARAAGDSPG